MLFFNLNILSIRNFVANFGLGYLTCMLFNKNMFKMPLLLAQRSLENNYANEDEEEEDMAWLTASVVCIIILLNVLTVGFEALEEYVKESSSKDTMPIINAMFGEMTVLGFLSMFTFLISQFDFISTLSDHIFGESEFLIEILEVIHYTLFFVMIFFIMQALLSAKQNMLTQEKWLRMELVARDQCHMKNFIMEQKMRGVNIRKLVYDAFHSPEKFELFSKGTGAKIGDQLLFYGLREEFLKDRSPLSFEPASKEKRVPDEFNFGRYLGVCMGKILTDIVCIRSSTWFFFIFVTLLMYSVAVCTNYNTTVLAWVWVFLGYFVLFHRRTCEASVENITKAFAGLEGTHLLKVLNEIENEDENVISSVDNYSMNESLDGNHFDNQDYFTNEYLHLPAWCRIDVQYMIRNRRLIKQYLLGDPKLNPQYFAFKWEHYGSKSWRLYLQFCLLFLGMYLSLLLVLFFPTIRKEYSDLGFILFIIISILPVFIMLRNQQHFIAAVVQAISVGSHRNLQAISIVCREQKISHLVRILFVLYKFKKACQGTEREKKSSVFSKSGLESTDLTDLSETFDQFKSGKDHMTVDDIKKMMTKVGLGQDENCVKKIMNLLDVDGDGEISMDEFFQWYAEIFNEDDQLTIHDRAKFLFSMFDKDDSGYITIGEFKEEVDALNVGFTVDEIGDIVNEIDEDGNGLII